LRPIRRSGPLADVLWEKNRVLVRRSHTVGDEVMNTTKQRTRYSIDLPPEAMNVLRWHVETQLTTDAQKDSELLFPSVTGGFRTPCVLNRPLADVAGDIKLGKQFSQRGLRRTFNDLARAAQVNDLVTRSISGHLTVSMQHHYSTVNNDEQRGAIAKVIQLFADRPNTTASANGQDLSGSQPAGGTNGGTRRTQGGQKGESRLRHHLEPALFSYFPERATGFEPATFSLEERLSVLQRSRHRYEE
jgi:hypothetical protein